MAVMARDSWTDSRLDDLNERVGRLELRMDSGFGEMREEFRAMRAEAAEDRRSAKQISAGIWATNIVGFLGVIAAVITHT
jgi:hypothetical protein